LRDIVIRIKLLKAESDSPGYLEHGSLVFAIEWKVVVDSDDGFERAAMDLKLDISQNYA